MRNKYETYRIFENIIEKITDDIAKLEEERRKYGRIRKFLKGIEKNLKQRQLDLIYYINLIEEYKKQGWV